MMATSTGRGPLLPQPLRRHQGHSVALRRDGLGRHPLLQARVRLHQRLLLLEPVRRRRGHRGHQPRQGPAPQLCRVRRRWRARDAARFAARRRCRIKSTSAFETICSFAGSSPGRAASSRSASSTSRTTATDPADARRVGRHPPVRAAGARRRQQARPPVRAGRGNGLRDARALLLPGLLDQSRPQRGPVPGRRRGSPFSPSNGSAPRPLSSTSVTTTSSATPGLNTTGYSTGGRVALALTKHSQGARRGRLRPRHEEQRVAHAIPGQGHRRRRDHRRPEDSDSRPELRLFYTWARWNEAARTVGVDSGRIYTDVYPQFLTRQHLRRAGRDLVVVAPFI